MSQHMSPNPFGIKLDRRNLSRTVAASQVKYRLLLVGLTMVTRSFTNPASGPTPTPMASVTTHLLPNSLIFVPTSGGTRQLRCLDALTSMETAGRISKTPTQRTSRYGATPTVMDTVTKWGQNSQMIVQRSSVSRVRINWVASTQMEMAGRMKVITTHQTQAGTRDLYSQ